MRRSRFKRINKVAAMLSAYTHTPVYDCSTSASQGHVMNTILLRTIQVGAALLVLDVLTVAILRIIGMMTTEQALSVGGNVALIIVVIAAAGAALNVVFGLGNNGRADS